MVLIRRMYLADTPAAATIADKSLSEDERFPWLYPRYNAYPTELRRSWLLRLKLRLVESGFYVFVAVEDNEVVGFAI
jgi:hypothetical protein